MFPNQSVASGQTEEIKYTPASNNIQEITITPKGYAPNNIILEAGKPTTINFKPEKGTGCLTFLRSDQLGLNVALKESTDNYINLKPLEPGTYEYSCAMNMFKGTILVK